MNEINQPSNFSEPDDVFVIENPATLKVLSDPLRIEIMRAFKFPATVKAVSKVVEMPSTKLYYHVKQLEKHGLVRVVSTNNVSGIIEKTYQVRARTIQVDEGLLSTDVDQADEQLESLLSIVFDGSKREAWRSLRAGLVSPPQDGKEANGIFSRGMLTITRDQADLLQKRIGELLKEFEQLSADNSADTLTYNLTIGFYQIAERLGSGEEDEIGN